MKWTKKHTITFLQKQAMSLALCRRGAIALRTQCYKKKKSGKKSVEEIDELGESTEATMQSTMQEMCELSERDESGKSKFYGKSKRELVHLCKRGLTALSLCNRGAAKTREKCAGKH